MTPAEHYRRAEELLRCADSQYMDDSNDALPRSEYESDADWEEEMKFGEKAHEKNIREAVLLAGMAQVHATLAVAGSCLPFSTEVAEGSQVLVDHWLEPDVEPF